MFRLICGYRLSVRVGFGFQICGGFGLWPLGFKYGLRGPRCGYRLSVRVGSGFRICGGFGLWALGFGFLIWTESQKWAWL